MRLLIIGAVCLGLAGCGWWQDYRVRRERADIVALYKACLERKQADPKLDCSEYRRAALFMEVLR